MIGRDVVIEATGSMRQVGAACGGRSTLLVDRLSSEVVPMFATRGVRLGVYSMLAVVWTSTAFAWGPQAHRVIARVAEERLSAPANAAVRELLIPPDTLPMSQAGPTKRGTTPCPGAQMALHQRADRRCQIRENSGTHTAQLPWLGSGAGRRYSATAVAAHPFIHDLCVPLPYFFSATFSRAVASARIRSGWSLNRSRQPVQQTQ